MIGKRWIIRAWFGGALYCQLALVAGAQGQQVLAPLPTIPTTPPAVEEVETNSAGFIDFGSAVPGSALAEQPFQVGPLDLHPHFFYRLLYATGIQSAPGLPHDTLSQDVSPGLLVGIGKNWTLDYTPTWTFYSDTQHHGTNELHDTLDHAVALSGGLTHGDWVFGFSQTYTRSDTPLIVTGGQTLEDSFVTTLTGSYRFNTVMSMDLSGIQTLTYPDGLTNTREWSTLDWLNYQFWPRLDGSLGIGAGYDNVSAGVDSVFEQYQARVKWRATDITSVQIHGGLEDRQFLFSTAGDLVNPIFGAEVKYKPFEVTALVLDADRTVSMSPFLDEVIEATDVTASLSQRLLKKLFLSVGGGYHWDTYVSTSSTASTGRRDEYYSISASLTCVILKHGTMAATYQHSGDSSTEAGFGYNSNQFGFQLGFEY
ncbi:MAG: outer membrane beta-barrel protein [Verrucomicrobiia bacterium]